MNIVWSEGINKQLQLLNGNTTNRFIDGLETIDSFVTYIETYTLNSH